MNLKTMENKSNLLYGISVKYELIREGKVIQWTEALSGCKLLTSSLETASHLSCLQLKDLERIVREELGKFVEPDNI